MSRKSHVKVLVVTVIFIVLSVFIMMPFEFMPKIPSVKATDDLKPTTSTHPAYDGSSASAQAHPNFATTEFTTLEYTYVQFDDGSPYANITRDEGEMSGTFYASVAHRFTFNLTDYSGVTSIRCYWDGYYTFSGAHATLNYHRFEIKNQTSSLWVSSTDVPTTDGAGWEIDIELTSGLDHYTSVTGMLECGIVIAGYASYGSVGYRNIAVGVYSDAMQVTVTSSGAPVCNYYKPDHYAVYDWNISIQFQTNWTDDNGLYNGRFGWNDTGTFTFDGWTDPWTGTPTNGWYNKTKQLPSDLDDGSFIEWKIEVNNTAGEKTNCSDTIFVFEKVPPEFSHDLGLNSYPAKQSGFYYNATDTGGAEAIYVCYLNTTAGGSTWNVSVKAFDLGTFTWTNPFFITTVINDAHWMPSLGYLPSGKLLCAYGYYTPTYYRISTYSIKTESNLATLLGNWGSQIEVPVYWSEQCAYPTIASFDDRTLVFWRAGSSSFNFWEYIKWVESGNMTAYARSWKNTTDDWFHSGDIRPYVQEDKNGYIGISDQEIYLGNFSFEIETRAYIENFDGKVYLQAEWKTEDTTNYPKVKPYTWNGSSWTVGSYVDLTTDYAWYEWNITSIIDTEGKLNDVEIKFYCNTGLDGNSWFYLRQLRIIFEGTGFNPAFWMVKNYPAAGKDAFYLEDLYQDEDGNIALGGYEYFYGSGSKNPLFTYSDDKCETWKYANGTTITNQPIELADLEIAEDEDGELIGGAKVIIDENLDRPYLFRVMVNPYNEDRFESYVQIIEWNSSLGNTGEWNQFNLTLQDGTVFTQSSIDDKYSIIYNKYYKRLCTWQFYDGHMQFFVAVPWNNTIYHPVYTAENGTIAMKTMLIFNAPQAYEAQFYHSKLLLGQWRFGDNNATTEEDKMYGCKFTANFTGYVKVVTWRMCVTKPNTGEMYGQTAIYNSTLHKLGTSQSCKVVAGIWTSRWTPDAMTFSSPPYLIKGESYYLTFQVDITINPDNVIVSHMYNAGATNQSFICDATYGTFPSILDEDDLTRGDQEITIYAAESRVKVGGFGNDPWEPSASNSGVNTTTVDMPCKFYTKWTDNGALVQAQFYWNTSGSMTYNGSMVLSGLEAWSNFTRTLPSDSDIRVEWFIIAQDNSGNWGNTTLQYLITTRNYAPVINELRLSTTTSETNITTIDVFVWYDWEVNVTDDDTLNDIYNLTIRIENDPSNTISQDTPAYNQSKEYWFRYLNASDGWEWYSGSAWTATSDWLDTANCAYPTKTGTNGWYLFRIKLSKVARKSMSWEVSALIYDSADNTATKVFSSITIYAYTELTVITTTHTWTGVAVGATDVLIDEGTITVNVTCNTEFNLQAKGNASYLLSSGEHQIGIGNITIHKDTLESAISLTITYANIGGLTGLNTLAPDTQYTFKLWLTVPDGTIPWEDYEYKCYVQAITS